MTKFPLPSTVIAQLETLPDTRRFVFDAAVYRGSGRSARDHVAIVRPLSKRTAKHDKLAVRASRDGIKPYRAPDYAARNAGLIGTIH